MESNIAVDLTEDERLFIGTVSSKNPCVGSYIKERCFSKDSNDWKIIALIRNNEFLFPDPDIKLEKKDEIIILSSKEVLENIQKNFKN